MNSIEIKELCIIGKEMGLHDFRRAAATFLAMDAPERIRIAEQAAERFGLELVIIHHRIGFIAVGEASLFLQVASPHRSEGFRASQWIVDELKKKAPIWKRPRFKVESHRHASHAERVGTTV